MARYIFRRLIHAAFTLFGVMLLTFLLFRVVAGDVSTAFVNQKLGQEARYAFEEKHKLDRPPLVNYHRRILLTDHTHGREVLWLEDANGSKATAVLEFRLETGQQAAPGQAPADQANAPTTQPTTKEYRYRSRLIASLDRNTPITEMTRPARKTEQPLPLVPDDVREKFPPTTTAPVADQPAIRVTTTSGQTFLVPVLGIESAGEFLDRFNQAEGNQDAQGQPLVTAEFSERTFSDYFDSQFFHHLADSVTFSGRSYEPHGKKLTEIIWERGRWSLAITVPSLALGWLCAMVISSVVAYYRDTWIDKFGVFLSVLGMCVPFLAYMILGQRIMFAIDPSMAFGHASRWNVYVPVLISVVAGVGASVRFYRTVILDQVNQDYVRTARAKGVPLPGVLFRHVLKNCMLPILTSLVTTIPFLILGSLLLERFFGFPGLGDLMISSISSRDIPIITGLTFLTALVYILGLLVTDILYAVFDPRVKLQ